MLGNVLPRDLKIEQTPLVYANHDNLTTLTITRLSGRRHLPVDLSAVTRWLLVLPTLSAAFDSTQVPAVFSAAANVLTLDLSGYAVPTSVQPCYLIAYDAEHTDGQVLVDNDDCVVQIGFRSVPTSGALPLPDVEYLTDAPQDGSPYGRQDGAWVPLGALVSGVTSVNGFSGTVLLNATHVGADPAGTASAAVSEHTAAIDPHPQYLLPSEGDQLYDALGAAAAVYGALATVAASGAYADLTGKPDIPSTAGDVGAIPTSEKGAALGVATLDAGSKIPLAQLPSAAITDTFVVNTEAAMLALDAQVGDVAIRPDITSSFILQTAPASTLGNWQQIITPSVGGGAAVGSATPQALGTATPGVSGNASREDHVHQIPLAGDVGAAPSSHVGATGAAHGNATTGTAGFMSAADKSKLDGVATGATANATDATLLARANHTGEQAISTVTGLQTALDKALFAPVITESGAARISALGDAGSYLRFTNTGAKTYTVQPQASVAWAADSEIHGRNAATTDLTLTPGSGVTLNAPFGGTLVVPIGGSFTLKRAAQDEWDVIGQTEAAA